jgi:hypothetical protein
MWDRGVVRRLTFWLPFLLLAVVLHVHPEGAGATGAPIVNSVEGACPICATMRGGLAPPAAPLMLPVLQAPEQVVAFFAEATPRLRRLAIRQVRGPPSVPGL